MRDALEKFKAERPFTAAERLAVDSAIKALNELVSVKDRTIAANERLVAVYDQIIKIQAQAIDRLVAQLNKPKSAWQKFVEILKGVTYVLAGIALGRGI